MMGLEGQKCRGWTSSQGRNYQLLSLYKAIRGNCTFLKCRCPCLGKKYFYHSKNRMPTLPEEMPYRSGVILYINVSFLCGWSIYIYIGMVTDWYVLKHRFHYRQYTIVLSWADRWDLKCPDSTHFSCLALSYFFNVFNFNPDHMKIVL